MEAATEMECTSCPFFPLPSSFSLFSSVAAFSTLNLLLFSPPFFFSQIIFVLFLSSPHLSASLFTEVPIRGSNWLTILTSGFSHQPLSPPMLGLHPPLPPGATMHPSGTVSLFPQRHGALPVLLTVHYKGPEGAYVSESWLSSPAGLITFSSLACAFSNYSHIYVIGIDFL